MGKKRRRAKDAGALDALSWTKVDEPSHAGFEMDEAGFNDLEEVDGDSVDVIETAPGVWEIRPKESTSSMLTGSSARANAATSTAAAGHQDAHLPDDNMTASSDVGSSRAGLTEKQKRLQAVVQERRERKRSRPSNFGHHTPLRCTARPGPAASPPPATPRSGSLGR